MLLYKEPTQSTGQDMVAIEVAYATAQQQIIVELNVPPGTTLHAAIEQSGILVLFPEIDLATAAVGVFSEVRSLDSLVANGDRIELYRPLLLDPKELRRIKANIL